MLSRGIRSRLLLAFLLSSLITIVLMGGYILWYDYQQNRDYIVNHLRSQAVGVSYFIEDMLASNPNQDLDTRVKELGTKFKLRVTVIAPDGTVIADSDAIPALMENFRSAPDVIAALTGSTNATVDYSNLSDNRITATAPIVVNSQISGVVRLSRPLDDSEGLFSRLKSALFLACFLATLLAIFISVRLARKFTEPLEEITGFAREIAGGNLDKRVHIRSGDEIEMLAHALNHLASNLEDRVSEIIGEKRKLELILQHMDNAVILLDRFGKVTMVNKAASEIFSIDKTMLGHHNIQVIGNSLLDRAVHDTVSANVSRLIDLKVQIAGAKRVFQVYLEPVVSSESEITGALCVFHDITTLQEIYERQSDFVANASHELATPLTAIKGFAETLLDGASSEPQLCQKFLNIIYTEADRMQRLVQDLLQLAKLDSQEYRRQMQLEPTPVKRIADMVVSELTPGWKRKLISLSVEHPPEPLSVQANPDWLKQVFVNLIDNGIKYTPEGGSVLLKYYRDQDKAVFIVKDSGIGIPPNDLPLIFDRFYRVDRARTRTAGGTGLGLAIVKFIIETLGGTISVTSEVNSGTTFTFSLPLATDE